MLTITAVYLASIYLSIQAILWIWLNWQYCALFMWCIVMEDLVVSGCEHMWFTMIPNVCTPSNFLKGLCMFMITICFQESVIWLRQATLTFASPNSPNTQRLRCGVMFHMDYCNVLCPKTIFPLFCRSRIKGVFVNRVGRGKARYKNINLFLCGLIAFERIVLVLYSPLVGEIVKRRVLSLTFRFLEEVILNVLV